jgi:hypothetical protein
VSHEVSDSEGCRLAPEERSCSMCVYSGMTFYINIELNRDLKRFVELLSEDLSAGEEVKVADTYRGELQNFAQKRKEWDTSDPKEFNDDIKYKTEINYAIDFKHQLIEKLAQMVYKDGVKDNFVQK